MAVLDIYFPLLALLAPLMAVISVGIVWGKLNRQPFPTQFITVLCTTVTTPCLVFKVLVTAPMSNAEMGSVALASVAALALGIAVSAVVLKLCRLPVRALLPTLSFPNAGNLGLPITHLAFGDKGLSASIAFFAVCSFVQNTLGVRILPKVADMPPIWKSPVLIAAILAAAFRLANFTPPQWIIESAATLGSLTVPLLLLGLGHALATIPSAGLRLGSFIGALRLVIGLVTGYAAAKLLGLPDDMASNMALQMGMPVAVISYLYARRYTDMGDVTAGAVLMSTLVFLVIAPALLWLLGSPVAR